MHKRRPAQKEVKNPSPHLRPKQTPDRLNAFFFSFSLILEFNRSSTEKKPRLVTHLLRQENLTSHLVSYHQPVRVIVVSGGQFSPTFFLVFLLLPRNCGVSPLETFKKNGLFPRFSAFFVFEFISHVCVGVLSGIFVANPILTTIFIHFVIDLYRESRERGSSSQTSPPFSLTD